MIIVLPTDSSFRSVHCPCRYRDRTYGWVSPARKLLNPSNNLYGRVKIVHIVQLATYDHIGLDMSGDRPTTGLFFASDF